MNQYVVIQRCYRDDCHDYDDAKEYTLSFYNTMEYAVEHVIKCMRELGGLSFGIVNTRKFVNVEEIFG